MNELMEKLIDEFEIACHLSLARIEREHFAHAVQIACKAQRNACARISNKHYGDSEHYDECCGLEIFTAEIRKEDYENN